MLMGQGGFQRCRISVYEREIPCMEGIPLSHNPKEKIVFLTFTRSV
jgi:hypothetical protein